MPLSLNEIRQRAIAFAREWPDAQSERSESQTFWNEFFEVFGVRRRSVASFEEPVRNLRGRFDYIDLIWRGKLIVEHKSLGGDLSRAHSQAMNYIQELLSEGREDEVPRYVLVSDFARFALHDLEETDGERQTVEFALSELHRNTRALAFIAGYETRRLDPEDDANIKAVDILGNLHDRLEDVGYVGHDLQRFMVRILFCLFAEDTGIFEPQAFKLFIQNNTREDGSDLGTQLSFLFQVLDTPNEERAQTLGEDVAGFPFVNGELFHEALRFPVFDSAMRQALLLCCNFHWERISPAVFGALFQSVMDDRERRQIGAHYTSERDILKLIRSLFLDDLRAEFERIRHDRGRLAPFHRRLGELRFLDPACGCGNFLVLSYRELRRLEMDVIQGRFGENPSEGDIRAEVRLSVAQFYGIEIEEWPVRIAEVALWLMDHQLNQELFERFGGTRPSIPLETSPNIYHGNALRNDWNDVLPSIECNYILGNPPFVGKQFRTDEQNADMDAVFSGVRGARTLDYVSAWYVTGARYVRDTEIRVAFVSTNSITQGEQVGVLWPHLFRIYGVKIHFAHRTFAWESEARAQAHVHVVIIGFGAIDIDSKRVYDYETDDNEPTITQVRNISPYLVQGSDAVVTSRSSPLCASPSMSFGNMPNDGGHLMLTEDEKADFLEREPSAAPYIRRLLGSVEFINDIDRWCLWLLNTSPSEIRQMPAVLQRVERVREHRLASRRATTRELAATPALFGEIRQPSVRYLAIPKTSSQQRIYIPMDFLDSDVIANTELFMSPDARLYSLGVLTSTMHMSWVRHVCGRLKSDYRYSKRLVYNNYPWPQEPAQRKIARVESCAQAVLDVRATFTDSSLADLYSPVTMPRELVRAHRALDTAVDRCYRRNAFTSDRQRFEFLFALYEELIAPLTPPPRARRRRSRGP